MTHYQARVELRGYVTVDVDADNEDDARDLAIERCYEAAPLGIDLSDADIDWIEERP